MKTTPLLLGLRLTLSCLVSPALAAHKGKAPAAAPAVDPSVVLDQALRPFVEAHNLAGIVAGVQMGDKATLRSYGDTGRPGLAMDEKTMIEIASISKTFTGLCLAEMLREGKVKLEDPAQKYFPAGYKVPAKDGREITLLDLVTHTSGLPTGNLGDRPAWYQPHTWRLLIWHWMHKDWVNPLLGMDDMDVYSMVSKSQLSRLPGSQWEYSNVGMGLLGLLMARVDGDASYEAMVKKLVTGPLGMVDTVVTMNEGLNARLAEPHDESGNKSKHFTLGPLAGAGGLHSDLIELMVYLNLHMGRKKAELPALTESALLMQQIYRTLHEPTYTRNLPLAWHQDSAANIYYHSGTGLGYHSYIGFDPTTQVGIVLLSNSAAQVVEEIGPEIIKTLEGRPAKIPKPLVVAELPESKLKAVAGDYQFEDKKTVSITVSGKGLNIDFHNGKPTQLWARSERSFFCKEWDCRVEFTQDEKGKLNGADVKMYYNTYHAKKVK